MKMGSMWKATACKSVRIRYLLHSGARWQSILAVQFFAIAERGMADSIFNMILHTRQLTLVENLHKNAVVRTELGLLSELIVWFNIRWYSRH